MKNVALLMLMVVIVFITTSCEKDNEKNPYQFQSIQEYWDFMEQHEWGCSLSCSDTPDDKALMYVYFEAEMMHGEFAEDDAFSLTLNGHNVPVDYDDYSEYLEFDSISIPKTSTVKVVFKRNNTVLFDKNVTIPAYPTITSFPSNPDWTQENTVKWKLEKNSHFQVLSAETWSNTNDRYKTYIVPPSARSYVIPANALYINNINEYWVSIDEANFTEYSNNVVVSITYDEINEYDKDMQNLQDRHRNNPFFKNMKR